MIFDSQKYCELKGFGIVSAAIVLRSYFGSKSRFAAATVLLRLGLIRRVLRPRQVYFGRTRSTSAEPATSACSSAIVLRLLFRPNLIFFGSLLRALLRPNQLVRALLRPNQLVLVSTSGFQYCFRIGFLIRKSTRNFFFELTLT